MDYEDALKSTDATVHNFASFGDYQGSWYAIITHKDKVGVIKGEYGSCSGCDAFQSEFGYSDTDADKLRAFGERYLDGITTIDEALQDVNDYASWDLEAKTLIDWLEDQRKLIHDVQFNSKFKKEILE
jgi:hypothetical protein